MWIQLLLIAGVVIIGALLMRRTGADSHLAIRRMLSGLFILAAILSILFPQWLSWVANLVGVGRGTDLLLYLFIVALIAFAVAVVRAKARTDARVTDLARAVALMEARIREQNERRDGDEGAAP